MSAPAFASEKTSTPTPRDLRRIVIVGGGISGLSAAWHLQKQAERAGLNVAYSLLEASDRWGGKVLSEEVDGIGGAPFVVEAGPDSFMTQKPWALQLARELGLSQRLLGTNDKERSVYVIHHGKPVVLPDGVLLIVPTRFMPFALSPLISPLGKLRMGLDLLIPKRRDPGDETLADFVRRRLGREALDKIAEPLMSGIYNAEAERQSILATFPRFRQMEQDHGGLIRGMLAARRKPAVAATHNAQPAKVSMFMSLQGGTQELVDALVKHLPGDLRLNARVTSLEQGADGSWSVITAGGEVLRADQVLLAIPAYAAAELVRPFSPAAAERLASIRYVSTGTVSLAYRTEDLRRALHGHGVVVPASEKLPINAITISSTKFAHRAPDGHVLIRVFFGGSRSPQSMTYGDEELLAVVRRELRSLLGIEATPIFHRIYRWHRANPQYDVNHLELVGEIEAALPADVHVTGSCFRGVGIPDCVYQAQQTVAQMVNEMQPTAFAEAKEIQ